MTTWETTTEITEEDEGICCIHCDCEFVEGDEVIHDTKLSPLGEVLDLIIAHPECREVFVARFDMDAERSMALLRMVTL